MDREQNKATQNQKVFVPLSAVLDFQKLYLESVAQAETSKTAQAPDTLKSVHRARKEAFERTIRTLGLPISIPF